MQQRLKWQCRRRLGRNAVNTEAEERRVGRKGRHNAENQTKNYNTKKVENTFHIIKKAN
jgi:hypothetical protein